MIITLPFELALSKPNRLPALHPHLHQLSYPPLLLLLQVVVAEVYLAAAAQLSRVYGVISPAPVTNTVTTLRLRPAGLLLFPLNIFPYKKLPLKPVTTILSTLRT